MFGPLDSVFLIGLKYLDIFVIFHLLTFLFYWTPFLPLHLVFVGFSFLYAFVLFFENMIVA